jgi:hypothetical protein
VKDNGRGIPVDTHPKWKMPARRRREVRQCPFRLVQGRGLARRQGSSHGVRARQDHAEARSHRRAEE